MSTFNPYYQGCQIRLAGGGSSKDFVSRVTARIGAEYPGADVVVEDANAEVEFHVVDVTIPEGHLLSSACALDSHGKRMPSESGDLILHGVMEIIREEKQ